MSGSRFSIFKSKRKRPTGNKVFVAGFGTTHYCLTEIDRSKSANGKGKYGFFDMTLGSRCPISVVLDHFAADAVAFVVDFRIPYEYYTGSIFLANKSELSRIINTRENAIVMALYDHRYETESEETKSDEAESEKTKSDEAESEETKSDEAEPEETKSDETESEETKSNEAESVKTESDEAESEETKSNKVDPEVEEWIKETSEKHRVGTFHVNTKTDEGFETAYEWLDEQITLDNTRQQEAKEQKIKEKASGYRWLAKLSKVALTFGTHST